MLKRIILKVSRCLAVVAVCASTFGSSACAFAEETSYQALLEENQLVQDSTGKLHTTSDCSYRNNLPDILGQLCTVGQRKTNGTGTIIVQADENLAGVRYSRSNGAPAQYGWYGKKTNTGRDAYCVEFGVPLNLGENTGFNILEAKRDEERKASLADYYGYYLQKTLPNKFYTESLINEIINGQTTTIYSDDLGQVSQAGYEAFKKDVMAKVNTFYIKPSFAEENITVKAGETKTLTDTNGSLKYYRILEDNANVNAKIQGNQLAITGKKDSKEIGKVSLVYSIDVNYQQPREYYENPYLQKNFVGGFNDPCLINLSVNVLKKGDVKIKKVDKTTGKAVPGTKFHVVFSGEDAPKAQDVTVGSDGTATLKDIMQGVHVKATETFVPAPYVLGSTVGDSDVVEGDVVANQTITLTQRNQKETGQIVVDKAGTESEKKMWNGNYSLAGNVFEIHEGTKTGQVVRTITTDKDGHAETGKDLPLGIYWVTEKQASQGFVRTFEPVEVKIEYGNQKIPVVVKEATGKNQEVVGSSTLTKEDAETGNEPQGSASFVGAEYALFHEDGTPVKWSEAFNPVLTHGTKVKDENNAIVIRIDEKDQKAGVAHLALGKYKWREVKAPIGYQIDQTDRTFELTYKDQETKVIETQSTSQENAIKFSLDGFKYVDSKSGDTKTGYNGIDFTLTPIDPTKGEQRKVTTETDENGYDGYWAFNEVPYGDYKMSEVKAPEGYKTIKDLIINSKFDAEKREYTFTITEDGQKEPIKTLTVPEAKINEGSNVIHLSKLFLTNKVKEMPTIRTKATVGGEKTFTPSKETPMQDVATITNVEKGVEYTNKIKLWRIVNDDYDNAKVVWEGSHDFVAEGDKAEDVIKQMVDTSKDDNTVSYVFTEELFIKDGAKVAEHNDLTNKEQTIRPVVPELPTIETLFVTKDGGKTFDPTKDQTLIDEVKATVPKEDIGQTFYYVTQFHKIDKNGKVTVVGTDESEHKAGEMTYEFKAVYNYKANTLKDGEKLVATHIAYTDKEHKNEYAKHFDLKNEKQTLTAKTPVTPATPQKSIPQTSGSLVNIGSLIVLGIAAVAGAALYVTTKKKVNKNEK